MSASYEVPRPFRNAVCPICHDMGWVSEVLFNVQHVRRCACNPDPAPALAAARHRERIESLCGLAGDERKKSLDVKWHPVMAPAAKAVYHMVNADPPSGFVVLVGPVGCGKTHILQATVNAALARNLAGMWQVTERLLDHIRESFKDETGDAGYDETMTALRAAPVLCLDEFGAEYNTPWAVSRLQELVDYRYRAYTERMHQGGCLTVLASNKPLDQWPAYLRSRAEDIRCQVFELWNAPNMRRIPKTG